MKPTTISNREQGTVFVIVTFFIVALFGFAGLSIDVGNTLLQRKKIHEACDAAALAAAVEWASGRSAAEVTTMAENFCVANGMDADEIVAVEPGTWVHATATFTGPLDILPVNVNPAVRVIGRRKVPMYFARIVGTSEMNPRVESVAVVGPAGSACCIVPWAGCSLDTVPTKCETIVLKISDTCVPGNFGALNLNTGGEHGGGANNYRDNIENNYPGIVHVGDQFYPESGDKVGPTDRAVENRLAGLPPYVCTATSAPPDNMRYALVPITTPLPRGNSAPVTVLGFWTIVLDDSTEKGEVTARFIDVYSGGEVDPSTPPVSGMLKSVGLVR